MTDATDKKTGTMTTATQQSINNHVDDQSQVDDRLRQAILDKKQAQIAAWSHQIKQLQQTLHTISSELHDETEKRVIELSEARDQALSQVESLQRATLANWETLLEQTDHLFQDLATRFHDFADKSN